MNEQQTPSRIRRSGMGTGTTSLLMIFTLLCLATLAMLSLTTARSDARIKQRGAEANISLAAAEGSAAEQLAQLDAVLAGVRARMQEGASENDYYNAAATALAAEGFAVDPALRMAAFVVPVDETSNLYTVVLLLPQYSNARYELASQATQTEVEWQADYGSVWRPGE